MTAVMLNGDFYSSNGVTLASLQRKANKYTVVVDNGKTMTTLNSPVLRGKYVKNGQVGCRIEFFGDNGKLLSTTRAERAEYKITGENSYVRMRVTYTRATSIGGFEEYYASGQPVINPKH